MNWSVVLPRRVWEPPMALTVELLEISRDQLLVIGLVRLDRRCLTAKQTSGLFFIERLPHDYVILLTTLGAPYRAHALHRRQSYTSSAICTVSRLTNLADRAISGVGSPMNRLGLRPA